MVAQANSQLPEKPIGEWTPDRYHMYPNPWVNASQCQTTETSGLCDYNKMLTDEQRLNFIEQPEMNRGIDKGNLCKNVDGEIRFMLTVAMMKQIGPGISDYRAAGKEFARKFRTDWNLPSCSVILVASNVDKTSFLDAGPDLTVLLTANITKKIDLDIYEEYFMKGLLADGINTTLFQYREVLEAVALLTTVPPSTTTTTPATAAAATTEQTYMYENGESSGYTPIIIGIIIPIIGVSIVAILIVILIKYKKRADTRSATEAQHLSPKPAADGKGQIA
jgi:hypothetical protein